MQKLILITGTPGTGKTTLAKKLAKDLNYEHIELLTLIKLYKWHEGYDRSSRSYLVDEAKVRRELSLFLRKHPADALIDTHLTAILKPAQATLLITCTCVIKTLKKRLQRRGYTARKIRDNLDAEIFEVCKTDAEKRYGVGLTYDSTKALRETYPSFLRAVRRALK